MRSILLGLALAALAMPARAEAPKTIDAQRFHRIGGSILCDTQEQLSSIIQSHIASGKPDGFIPMLAQMTATRNQIGEPVCAPLPPGGVVMLIVKRVAQFDGVPTDAGARTFYVIEVQYGNGVTGYIAAVWDAVIPLPGVSL